MTRTVDLKTSYAHCGRIARRAASSFYYSFYLLPSAQRQAMNALYAYLRKTDDLADAPVAVEGPTASRGKALSAWRTAVETALASGENVPSDGDEPILPALVDTVRRFEIPHQYLRDVIDGVEMDLEPHGYETFADLERYCYRVASVVGLSCLHIWGFEGGERAFEPARQCGIAFQLTNILRDVPDDAREGRVYLPREDLARFACSEDDLRQRICRPHVRKLMQFEIERAESLFREAATLQPFLSPMGRRMFSAMLRTYRQLLHEIARREGDVFSRRVRLPRWRRLQIVAHSALMPNTTMPVGPTGDLAAGSAETPTR